VSRATATVTLIGLLFPPDERLQFVHLHGAVTRCIGRRVVGRVEQYRGGMGGDPVGDALMDDPQEAADSAQTHPFEIEPHRLVVDGSTVSLLFRGRGEIPPTSDALIALGAGVVASGLERRGRATMEAGDGRHGTPPRIQGSPTRPVSLDSPLLATPQMCGTQTVANTPQGWVTALEWAGDYRGACRWGIENSGSLGKGFAQFLLADGETNVREVSPQRTAQYRRRGRTQDKTDAADALAIARLISAEGEQLPLVQADDLSTERRILSDHRDNLVAERTRLINQLHAQMLQIDPCSMERSGVLTTATGVRYCHALVLPHADGVLRTRLLIVH